MGAICQAATGALAVTLSKTTADAFLGFFGFVLVPVWLIVVGVVLFLQDPAPGAVDA